MDIGALIAADSALVGPAVDAVRAGADGVAAVRAAAEAQAAVLAALPDPDLAQRAGDVRQVAAAVVDHLRGNTAPPPPAGTFILVRREVDPADLIQLADGGLAGAVSVAGGASSHAAIIARGLGLPMLAGADPRVLAAAAGHPAILDAGAGELIVDPDPQTELDLAAATRVTPDLADRAPQRVTTADGEPVTLLCNVASAAETRLGLSGGAAGVGLLRTEIPFTGASGWPSQADHLAQLTPVLGLLAGRPAVVRLLDFSGDKIPPFLAAKNPAWPRCSARRKRSGTSSGRSCSRAPIPSSPSWSRWSRTWTRWPRSAPRWPRPPPRPVSTRPSSASWWRSPPPPPRRRSSPRRPTSSPSAPTTWPARCSAWTGPARRPVPRWPRTRACSRSSRKWSRRPAEPG